MNHPDNFPKPPVTASLPSLPEAYYDKGSLQYWIRAKSALLPMNETSMKRRLKQAGFSNESNGGKLASEIDDVLTQIQDDFGVDYAGKLAGWPIGYFSNISDRSLLITSASRLIEPTYGNNTLIADMLERMLGNEQATYFHGWIKLAMMSRRRGIERIHQGLNPNFRPGQAMCIAGEPGQGKTLLSKMFVKMVSGSNGLKADPTEFAMAGTSFNEDTSEREAHVMDDEGGSDSYTARRQFGDAIKKSVATSEKRVHGKGKKAETFELYVRTMILLNSKLSNLQVLPPLESGVGDKLMLMKCVGTGPDRDTSDDDRRDSYWEELCAAIPDYLGALENWEIPEEIRDSRYGIKHYHNPDILKAMDELGQEVQLLHIIDACDDNIFGSGDKFIGTSSELHSRLLADPSYGAEARNLAKSSSVFGKILSTAADRFKGRVKSIGRSNGGRERYEISRAEINDSPGEVVLGAAK